MYPERENRPNQLIERMRAGRLQHWLFLMLPLWCVLAGELLLYYADGWPGWWAFAFLAYVPDVLLRGAALLLIVAAMVPYIGWAGFVELRLAQLGRSADRKTAVLKPVALRWLGWGAALGLFWFLRERSWHGDALYKIQLWSATPFSANPYVWKEPLNSLLEFAAIAALQPLGGGPEQAIALLSVAAGGVYLIVVWLAASWLAEQPLRQLSIGAVLLAGGGTLLWFGHVENYSWSTATVLGTLVLALGHLRGRVPLWAVGVLGGTAASFHPQSAFVLPALLLLLRRPGWLQQGTVLAISGAVVPGATLLLLRWAGAPWPNLTGGFAGDPQLFWTVPQALAPARLADALQNLWLIAPLWLFWLVAGLSAGFAGGTGRGADFGSAGRAAREFRLLAAAVAGLLLYFFTFQNDLPRQRDWDLFAVVAPPLALWGIYSWYLWIDRATSAVADTLRQTLVVGLCFAMLYSSFWVGVNHVYTLVRPDPAERERLTRYRLLDLTELLPQAQVMPESPICPEPTGCERVILSQFVMPHTGDARAVIFAHAPAQVVLPVAVPAERTFLWLSPALDPQAWDWGGDGVKFAVKVRSQAGERLLWERFLTPARAADREWQQAIVPLDEYRGQQVALILVTDPGPVGDASADRAGWGMPWLMRGTALP